MKLLENYPIPFTFSDVEKEVAKAKNIAKEMYTLDNLKLALNLIDLTTLNATDSTKKGKLFAENVNKFEQKYTDIPNVAAICVYPPLVKTVSDNLKVSSVGLASVGAGFPSSQTYLEVKILECKKAVANGATDIDIVISQGTWLLGDYETVFNEIKSIKEAIGKAHLKVILETGALQSLEHIWNASIISMSAGADFIKTSTGKITPAATPEAVYIMAKAIDAYNKQTNKKIGIKPAGGMVSSEDALLNIAIVKMVLGSEWLNNKMFRLGASRLANNLLSDILTIKTGKETKVTEF